ncbi:MAG: ROK family protein [Candidatus Muiribacteriota bacterium]
MYLGIDFGGTNIRGAVLNKNGRLMQENRMKTEAEKGFEYIFNKFLLFIKDFMNEFEIEGVGIGFPGTVNRKGLIVTAPNLGWNNINLKEKLQNSLKIPVIIDNDVNMAICGEKWKGVAKNYREFFMLTIGTGVGGAFFINNKFYGGVSNNAGEIGHMNIEYNGRKCGCGKRGCLEQYASATALINYIETKLNNSNSVLKKEKNIQAKEIFEGARKGDKLALEGVNFICTHLGRGISNVVNLLNPEAVIIGGGVSQAGDFLLNILEKEIKKYSLSYSFNGFDIKLAQAGELAGIYGSVYNLLERKE